MDVLTEILSPGGLTAWRNVSLGALCFGLVFIAWHLGRWKARSAKGAWRTKHGLGELIVPFLPLWCFGSVLILCANGIVGWVAGLVLWLGDLAGKHALREGVGAGSPDVTRAATAHLTDPGYVVLILTIAFTVAYAKHKGSFQGKGRWNVILPVASGVCMGLSQGVAGAVGSLLGPAMDTLGAALVGWV